LASHVPPLKVTQGRWKWHGLIRFLSAYLVTFPR